MRTRLPLQPFLALACLAALAAPQLGAASAKETSSAAAKTSDPFTITVSSIATPELKIALMEMEAMERAAKVGRATDEQLTSARLRVEALHERLPAQLNVESKGGPLSEFLRVAALQRSTSLTVINAGEPADLETPIPAFKLRNASWVTIVQVLGTFLNLRGLDLKIVGGDNPQHFICMLRRAGPSAAEKERASTADFESIQLSDYLRDKQPVEFVIEVIRAAWEMDPAHDPTALRLKFHPPTKILLVSGPAPAGQIAQRVIAGLSKNPVQK